jgi:hypothetical protein
MWRKDPLATENLISVMHQASCVTRTLFSVVHQFLFEFQKKVVAKYRSRSEASRISPEFFKKIVGGRRRWVGW